MPLDPTDLLGNGEVTRGYDGHIQAGSRGVDVDSRGLPEGSRADITSPISGTVTAISPDWGMVRVTDQRGNHHDFIHLDLDAGHAQINDPVTPGDRIGAIGSTVPEGKTPVRDHLHYQIKDPNMQHINPETYDYEFPS